MKNSSIRPRDDGRAARRVIARRVSRDDAWFDDEIAIDFPSLDEAVERMRDGFLAPLNEDDRPEIVADLGLSPREAFDGAVVPIDLPVRKLCKACGGRGEVWSDPCDGCDGIGHLVASLVVRLVVPPRVQDGDRFSLLVSAPSASPTRVEVIINIQ